MPEWDPFLEKSIFLAFCCSFYNVKLLFRRMLKCFRRKQISIHPNTKCLSKSFCEVRKLVDSDLRHLDGFCCITFNGFEPMFFRCRDGAVGDLRADTSANPQGVLAAFQPARGAARGVGCLLGGVATPRRLTARTRRHDSGPDLPVRAVVVVVQATSRIICAVDQAVGRPTESNRIEPTTASESFGPWRVRSRSWGPELVRAAPEWHLEAAPEPLSPDDLGSPGRRGREDAPWWRVFDIEAPSWRCDGARAWCGALIVGRAVARCSMLAFRTSVRASVGRAGEACTQRLALEQAILLLHSGLE